MNCPSCGVSNPDGAAFCQSCGTRVSAAPGPPAPAPAYVPAPAAPYAAYPQAVHAQPLRPAKPALDFLPNALSPLVLPLACVSFGALLLNWILDRADGQTMFLGALLPILEWGCLAALWVALWDGLRRLSHPLAGLAGLLAAAETVGVLPCSYCQMFQYAEYDSPVAPVSDFCYVTWALYLALGVGLFMRHSGRGRLLGVALAAMALCCGLSEAVFCYAWAIISAEALGAGADDVLRGTADFISLLFYGFSLVALCRVLFPFPHPRAPAPWPPQQTPCAPPPAA